MKKENLEKLIGLIAEIVKDHRNEWFVRELFKIVRPGFELEIPSGGNNMESRVIQIQKYLHINFNDIIDYSDFDEPSSEQLTRDCIEMCRYKSGTPNHKIDFEEFCRYAHLQIEEMFNYYLNKISNNDITIARAFMRSKNNSYNEYENYLKENLPKHVHQIKQKHKIYAFHNACTFTAETKNIILNLNEIRNKLSHRDSLSASKDEETLKRYFDKGFSPKKRPHMMKGDPLQELYNDGNLIIWKREKDFVKVFAALQEVKMKIASLPLTT